MAPLVRIAGDALKARGLLRGQELEERVDRPVPDVVGDLEDVVERFVPVALEDAVLVDAVDLHDCRPLAELAPHHAGVDAHLTRKLLPISDDPFVRVRLVPGIVEHAIGRLRRHAGRDERRLEGPVEVGVVEVAESGHVGAGRLRRLGQHVGDPRPARANRAPAVARQQIVDTESGADLRAVLRLDVERRILAADEVGSDACAHGQLRERTPRVLNVDGVIVAVSPPQRHVDLVVHLTMKRDEPRRGIRRISKHDFLERVAPVRVVLRGALVEPGLEIDSGLNLVRSQLASRGTT